jgi:PAS domain-containing protein
MFTDPDVVRRWTRALGLLRTRRRKLPVTVPDAAVPIQQLLDESLDLCATLLQEFAGAELRCHELRDDLRAGSKRPQYLLDQMPIACVATNAQGVIELANHVAAELLNVSAKHLRGRLLIHFSGDRAGFDRLLLALPATGGRVEAPLPIRPRERGPCRVTTVIVPADPDGTTSGLWFLMPAGSQGVLVPAAVPSYAERDTA